MRCSRPRRSSICRLNCRGCSVGRPCGQLQPREATALFLNTHPAEMNDPGLVEALQGLRDVSPRQPITLEIHESAATDGSKMHRLQDALADLDMKWAYDDFGAGRIGWRLRRGATRLYQV